MKEKKMSKSVYDDFQERSEAIGSKGVVVKAGPVGEGKSFLSQNMTYCPNCGDLVHFTVQDEVLEEEFKGVMNKEIMIKFPFRVGRCNECGHEVATDNEYNVRRNYGGVRNYAAIKISNITRYRT